MILKEILVAFGDRHFNKAAMAVASSKQAFGYMEKHAESIMNKTIFVYEEKAISIKTIMVFAFILFVGLVIARVYKKIVDRFRKKNRIKSLSIARLIANSGYYIIILSSFFIALDAVGLDTHTIFVITGAILLWLALGLQGFISNYAMGILLKIDRSIRIGDHIELDKNIVGVIDDMDFRSITILTSNNSRYTVPNSRFIAGEFINHSLEDSTRRIQVPFSVDKRYTLEEVQQKVLDALDNSDVAHLKSVDKKARVIITDINRKIVRYSLLVWVKKRDNPDMDILQSTFLHVIQQGLISRIVNR
jgi:small-conductance mechanosensitive channel